MRISDWSSDVCSSDLTLRLHRTHNSQPTNTGGDKAGPFQGGSMNTTLTASPPELREALYSLSMAKDVPDAALLDDFVRRSEERRVGKECVSTCRSRWSPYL